jgi:hypothetical protein
MRFSLSEISRKRQKIEIGDVVECQYQYRGEVLRGLVVGITKMGYLQKKNARNQYWILARNHVAWFTYGEIMKVN